MQNTRRAGKVCVLVVLLVASFTPVRNILSAESTSQKGFESVFQKGMSYRHYPFPYDSSYSNESLQRMAEANVEYVAVTVWWVQENVSSTQIYAKPSWTPTDRSLAIAVHKAHELGMKVMLKPMIDPEDVYAHWRGEIRSSPEWFESYRAFIGSYARFAQENDVDLFCVGCEFQATEGDKASWEQVINEVKDLYSGPLTYAATFDSFQSIAWWDRLDYVGVDAYFPLTNKKDPTLKELKQAWNRIANGVESWVSTVKKPVVFTEIGYRSGDGTNAEPANWKASLALDLQEQFDCYLAAFQTLWGRPWFYGFYWWIWESNPAAGGLYDTDFTPQNKQVEYLLRSWYSSETWSEETTGVPWAVVSVAFGAVVAVVLLSLLIVKLGRKRPYF